MILPQLPSAGDLRPWLDRLEANEGRIVLIALESFRTRNDCRCTVGWFSSEEKKALKTALLKARAKRTAKQEAAKANAPLHDPRTK